MIMIYAKNMKKLAKNIVLFNLIKEIIQKLSLFEQSNGEVLQLTEQHALE